MEDSTSVKVALRIRPQIPREILDMCHVCTCIAPGEPQVWIGKDKAFTFDHVFDMPSSQDEVYDSCVKALVEGCFEGYNATVLAYGQTGSGKTYTMGTGLDINVGTAEQRGIIPRAVEHLFSRIGELQREARARGDTPPEFKVNAQFMELYNEDIIDLLDPAREADDKGRKSYIKIHEDSLGGIYTMGVTTRSVVTVDDTMHCLKVGALSRTTASTQMNAQSSRSHAIFTLHIKQQRVVKITQNGEAEVDEDSDVDTDERGLNEFETLTAKFHFVDLAGSERLKRTGATGERAKEGISINCGLLALGNVISALGDKSRKVSHVPYRDSKLTRLLQDSLGGNSRTLMIACVSPSDRDFMETLNTLKYANRAKNIKNRVVVNQDKSSQTISALRRQLQQLQLELMEYKQGKRVLGEDGSEQVNDMFHENTMLQAENGNLRTRIKALQETVERLTSRNTELLAERTAQAWITSDSGEAADMTQLIQGYLKEVEELRTKLMESEEMCVQLRKQQKSQMGRHSAVAITGQYDVRADSPSVYQVLDEAKRDVRKLKKKSKALKASEAKEKTEGGGSEEENSEKASDETENKNDNNMDESISEMNGELSSEDEEEEDSSYSEEGEEKENYSEDLAALTCEISIKQKLIEELELSQRRLSTMRQHYEEKLLQLQNRIRETEIERDRVLAGLSKNMVGSGGSNQAEEKVKRVREEFERKLSTMQSELKKLQSAKREHSQLMKNQAQYERQVRQLKQEVQDMKRAKVRLVQKMKEEGRQHKEAEARRVREIAQLRKEGRQRENRLRSLEAERKAKEAVLRRRQEEVAALRKLARPMSDRVAGRHRSANGPKKYSPRQAKLRWQTVEKNINRLALNKQTVYNVERDMERWLHEREKLSRCLERIIKKRDRAILEKKDEATIRDLEDQVENIKANVDYIHENITECQSSIVQMEEAKEEGTVDPLDMTIITTGMDLDESKYLLEKLLNMAINQSIQAAQREASVKELEARMKQMAEQSSVQQELLQHVIHQANEDLYNILMNTVDQGAEKTDLGGGESSRSVSPTETNGGGMDMGLSSSTLTIDSTTRKDKARHRAVTKEDLLYAGNSTSDLMVRSMVEEKTVAGHRRMLVSSQSFKEISSRSRALELSPALRRKFIFTPPTISRHNSLDTSCDLTPPHSPPISQRKDNVFSRLTSGSSVESRSRPDRGMITPYLTKTAANKMSPLLCTHVADGHSKAVLSLAATDDVLFSGSKDRTVKVWDLHTGQEIQSFTGHPNNVVAIRYCEYTRLAFSVSTAYVKVWDVRENPAHCIKTLCSSGLTNNGPVTTNTPSRVIQMPNGEHQINDIALNHYGTMLFSASGPIVRIWDLRMFHSVGKLSGSHQAAVMCLAVDELGMDNNLVVTGSRDHSIKMFEVPEGLGGVHSPKVNLDPPHYDGVQGLAINGDHLFSCSRDMSIKKWDLSSATLVQSVNQAHKDWVCALTFLPRDSNLLLSSCRQGYVKLWAAQSCRLLGEVRAHGAHINSLATNSVCVFTASNDCTVGIWRVRSTLDHLSPDASESIP